MAPGSAGGVAKETGMLRAALWRSTSDAPRITATSAAVNAPAQRRSIPNTTPKAGRRRLVVWSRRRIRAERSDAAGEVPVVR